jgi:hypothetical protein
MVRQPASGQEAGGYPHVDGRDIRCPSKPWPLVEPLLFERHLSAPPIRRSIRYFVLLVMASENCPITRRIYLVGGWISVGCHDRTHDSEIVDWDYTCLLNSGDTYLAIGCAGHPRCIDHDIRLIAGGQSRVSRKRRTDLKSNARKQEMRPARSFNCLYEMRVIPCVHRHSVNNGILFCI